MIRLCTRSTLPFDVITILGVWFFSFKNDADLRKRTKKLNRFLLIVFFCSVEIN